MRAVPPAVLRSWPAPNYVNPENRYHSVIISSAICIAIIVPVVTARLWTRTFLVKSFGTDDWLIIPAALTGLGYCVAALLGIQYGWYRNIWDVPITMLHSTRKLVVAASLLGLLNVGFTKLSILCLYKRLMPVRWFQLLVNGMLGVIAAWMVAMTITNFMFCIPLNAYWDIYHKGHQVCLSEVPYFASFSAVDLVLDVIVWVLPLFIIIPLQIPKRQKYILGATFAVGLLTIISAALRLPSILRASKSYNLTWELFDAAIWAQVEAAVGITCASVPALKPLVVRYAPKILNSIPSRSRGESGYYDMAQPKSVTRKESKIKKTTEVEICFSPMSSASKSKVEDEVV